MSASRPRVLLASPRPPPVGGIATWTESVLASPLACDFDLHCVDTAPRDAATDRPSESRFRPARALRAVDLLARFAGACLRLRPDVVHVCTSYHWALARDAIFLALARASGARSVLHLRGGDFAGWADGLPAGLRRLPWRALRLADRVIALDEPTRARVAEEVGAARALLLPSFVAAPVPSREETPGSKSDATPGLMSDETPGLMSDETPGPKSDETPGPRSDETPLRIVFIGAVIEAKGVLELLEAAAAVPAVELTLAGPPDASLAPRLEAAVARLGERARLAGVLGPAEVAAALQTADVFVLPSHREGLPISLLEAMAAGLAIVATPVGAIPEAVRDGEEGLLVPLRDPAALAAALAGLARDRRRCRELGARARARWREVFSPEAGIARLRSLWTELAAR